MGSLFRVVREICDKEEKGIPSFFVTNLIHQLTGRMLLFMLQLKPKVCKFETGRF